MRSRLNNTIIFLAVLGISTAAVLVGSNYFLSRKSNVDQTLPSPTAPVSTNVIERENALHGTIGWEIPRGSAATTQIQAYASATSVSPGQKLTFYVSTQVDGTLYSLGVYRLGWYGGMGGRLKFLLSNQV